MTRFHGAVRVAAPIVMRSISRVAAAALAGVLAGSAALVLAFTCHPDLTLEMDRDLPRIVSGFYPVERDGDRTFAWTSARATVKLPDADRSSTWTCAVVVRGARPDGVAQPVVALEIDGIRMTGRTLTNDDEELTVTAPVQSLSRGLSLAIVSAPTFVPSAADPRQLGVQIDRLSCRPDSRLLVMPPRHALIAAAKGSAIFGAAAALTGMTMGSALVATVVLAALQAIPLSIGPAPYESYLDAAVWLALWTAIAMLLGITTIEWRSRQRLRGAGLFAMVFSAGALDVKLLALLHPSKLIVDALFHAHRFEWVLGGQYFFTQPVGSGVQFPYAIALYVFAAPWSVFTRDHVALLRIVVAACEAVAGALLYPMIVKTWGNRLAGAMAVALFTVVPLSYSVVGNANLTNAFGQSASLAAVAAAVLLSLQSKQIGQLAGLSLLAALGLLSHVSTFGLLLATLLAMAFLYRAIGGRALHGPAWRIAVATTIAAVFSVAIYYGHFGEVYKTVRRVRTDAPAAGRTADAAPAANTRPATPLPTRVVHALGLGVRDVGWPILLLAIVGLWRLWHDGARDRLGLTIAAWGMAYAVFVAIGALAPVDAGYERYADEFIDRAIYATYPAAIVLAGRGGAWAWRAGIAGRLASAGLLAAAAAVGLQHWLEWMR